MWCIVKKHTYFFNGLFGKWNHLMSLLRSVKYSLLLNHFGAGAVIGSEFIYDGYETIDIGKNTKIGNNCRFFGKGGITLGDYVLIADNVSLCSATYDKQKCIQLSFLEKFIFVIMLGLVLM